IAHSAHAAFEHIADPELPADLLHIHASALVGEAGVARAHEEPLHARQRGDDVFGDTVAEVLLFRIATHVVERQNRHRRPGWQRQVRLWRLVPLLHGGNVGGTALYALIPA